MTNHTTQRRVVITKAMLRINSILADIAPPLSSETSFVLLCVNLGNLEDRPMDVSDVSQVLGWSRTTVRRHLVHLEKHRLAMRTRRGRRAVVLPTLPLPATIVTALKRLETLFVKTCKELDAMAT